MKLYEKKKTLELLEKLRILNYKSAFIYDIAQQKENRLILKNTYQKLYRQKRKFLEEIEEKIDQLKKEISPIPNPELLNFYHRKKFVLSQLYLKYKLKCNFNFILKRELKSFRKYQRYLSKTNHGCARELILNHKHRIKSTLNEMNSTGISKYSIS